MIKTIRQEVEKMITENRHDYENGITELESINGTIMLIENRNNLNQKQLEDLSLLKIKAILLTERTRSRKRIADELQAFLDGRDKRPE